LVDTHAHLDDASFDHDREGVLTAAGAAGVRHIVNVGYAPERWTTTLALASRHPSIVAILGLHPQQADRFDQRLCRDLEAALAQPRVRGVGEIGFDLFRDGPELPVQRRAFDEQVALAIRHELPIVIHQRAAEEALIEALRDAPKLPRVLLHSFDGSHHLAELAINRGFLVGIGGLATLPGARDLREVLATIPLASLVLETDAPYLAPAGAASRRSQPANVALVAGALAPLWKVTPRELAEATTRTASAFFRLGDSGQHAWHGAGQ
jgi:TatD DNase family protein